MTATLETMLSGLTTAVQTLVETTERQQQAEEERQTRFLSTLEQTVKDIVAQEEPQTPSRREEKAGPLDAVHDRFDMLGYTRSDFELAGMIFDGAKRMRSQPVELPVPEDFRRAWLHHLFEVVPASKRIWIADEKHGKPVRAMDTAESGFGQQLIGAQYIADLWQAARAADPLVSLIRTIPMNAPTVYIPIDGALPEMLFVGESTTNSASAYGTSKTASNRRQMDAKKFTIQQIWSGELDEDSIIAFVPFLREKLNMSAGLHLGSAMYNGDTTNAATGNINSDDADPTDTKHYLAWDGIRHYWLVDTATQGYDMAGPLNVAQIGKARGRLNGTDDDIDAAVGNINWGANVDELVMVCDWDTYLSLLNLDEVVTVDKYGPNATVLTGELGRYQGIRIIAPSYASKTEADGKASGTESNNTKGQITLLNPRGFLGGVRRDVQLYFDRIQRTDQYLFELYTRRGFCRFGEYVSSGIYDITV